MPALNFLKCFAVDVESGHKKQTIRAKRKYPIRAGSPLFLYTGMRTKSCRKLRDSTCTVVRDIYITESSVKIEGDTLYRSSLEALATADGFESVEAFKEFFKSSHGLPFKGDLIEWN